MSENKKSQRQSRRAKQKRKEQMKTVWMIVIATVVIMGVILLPNLAPREIVFPETPRDYSLADGMAYGSADAPVVVAEYSDFQCPYCMRWFNDVEPQLLESYVEAGLVRFEYHTAGEFLGPESGATVEALYCANDQGKFWQMHDIIFLNQPQGENTGFYNLSNLTAMAVGMGLNENEFETCLSSQKYEDQVKVDFDTFQSLGLSGTPSILVNGRFIEDPSIQSIANAIEAALAASGN